MLLHPTSLPRGELGDDARRFIEWLRAAGFTAWQMLPVGPPGPGGSPYSSYSAFAGHAGLLAPGDRAAPVAPDRLEEFRARQSHWLEDHALFVTVRAATAGLPWWRWPEPLRQRDPGALAETGALHRSAIADHCASQYRFDRAWQRLRTDASGLWLIGDLPMFVIADSVDAWAQPGLFRLDGAGRPATVAGVPPDYFAPEGQCWNTPVYDWDALARSGFAWWRRRLQHALSRFDQVRWDHFRGLVATWEIPVGPGGAAAPAVQGRWRPVPGRALLDRLRRDCGSLPVIAENLGDITPEVENLRRDYDLPGLHVMQFAFDGSPDNPHLPANHEVTGVAFTGTHDNDTTRGWWESLDETAREAVFRTLPAARRDGPEALITAVLESRCRLAMLPMQDVLGLGSEARMNRPGVAAGQWRWRFGRNELTLERAVAWRCRLEAADRL